MSDVDIAPHAPERRRIEGDGTHERAWDASRLFERLAPIDVGDWQRDFRRIWVLAPHPDDEVLALGGSLAALSALQTDIRIVCVTDGEASHRASAGAQPARRAAARQAELRQALAALHVDAKVDRLGLPDGRIDAHRETLLKSLADVVDERDLLLTTCRFDGDSDHEACGEVAQLVGEIAGATVYEYPVWMWHWAAPAEPIIPWNRARRLAVSPATLLRKRLAIDAFVSQVTTDGIDRPGVPAHLIPRFLRPYEVVFA